MGSYLAGSTTSPRQSRRLATSAIGLVAVIGLVTACTASSVGAAKRAPDRYPAGATLQVQAQSNTSDETPQQLRKEQQDRRALNVKVAVVRGPSEYQLMRLEHVRTK